MSQDNLLELIYKETQEIREQQNLTNKRLDRMDERFDGIDCRLDEMDERFDGIDRRLDAVDERFDGIDRRLDAVDERFDRMDLRLDNLTDQVSDNTKQIESIGLTIKNDIQPSLRRIELSIENEIRPNIMRIAEAHLDLNRKLDEALKSDREREMVVLKLNFLDGEVRRLNERVNSIA